VEVCTATDRRLRLSKAVELRQIEYFFAVAEEGSFTRAAARLFMGQSSLSASVLALERELGTQLFKRGRNGTELTDAGQAFLEPARAALADLDRARDAVAEVRGALRGSVRIAALAMPPRLDLAEAIARFHRRHPNVQIQVFPTDSKSMIALVAEGQVDFAITPRIEHMTAKLSFEPLIRTPLALLCPSGHRLAGAQDVDPRDVIHELVIDLPRSWLARELFDRLLAGHGMARQIRLEVSGWLAALGLVQKGVGIAYGPHGCHDRGIFRRVRWAALAGAPVWEIGVATREEALRGAAARAFLADYLCHVRNLSPDHRSASDRGTEAPEK
jgi:DNA-binding transcriptional LysR family regulator